MTLASRPNKCDLRRFALLIDCSMDEPGSGLGSETPLPRHPDDVPKTWQVLVKCSGFLDLHTCLNLIFKAREMAERGDGGQESHPHYLAGCYATLGPGKKPGVGMVRSRASP